MGRNRQAGLRPGMHLDRRAFDGAGELVFRLPGRQVFESGDEQRGILAVDDGDRTGLALVPVFLRDDRAVPAGMVELHGHLVPAVHLHAIDRGVDPAAVRIAHDDDRARADEGPAVVAMPDRRRKLGEIDVVARDRVFQRSGASLTVTGACGLSVLRFSIQALSASSGRSVGSRPSASAARCGLVMALVKMRNPRGKPLISSNSRAGQSGMPGRDLGDAADLETRIGARRRGAARRASRPSSMNSRKSLYMAFAPAALGARQHSRPRALWSGALPRYSFQLQRFTKERGHGQASPHRAHRSRSRQGRQVLRGGLRHEGRRQGAPRPLCVRRHRQRCAAEAGGQTRRSASTISACGSTISTRPRRRSWTPAATYLDGRPTVAPNALLRGKYKDPLGIVFDLTHKGWVGAVKDVVRARSTLT